MQKELTVTQEDCLQIKARENVNRTPLVTTFSPHTPIITEIANRNWDFLKSKEISFSDYILKKELSSENVLVLNCYWL